MMVVVVVMMMMNGFVTSAPSTFQSSVQTSFYMFLYEAEISCKPKTAQMADSLPNFFNRWSQHY